MTLHRRTARRFMGSYRPAVTSLTAILPDQATFLGGHAFSGPCRRVQARVRRHHTWIRGAARAAVRTCFHLSTELVRYTRQSSRCRPHQATIRLITSTWEVSRRRAYLGPGMQRPIFPLPPGICQAGTYPVGQINRPASPSKRRTLPSQSLGLCQERLAIKITRPAITHTTVGVASGCQWLFAVRPAP